MSAASSALASASAAAAPAPHHPHLPEILFLRRLSWNTCAAAILILAALLRFVALDVKPAHFDEGINGWFADGIKARGYFIYDPENYHGPWHFYWVHAAQALLGRSETALRLPASLASFGAVACVLALKPFFGGSAVLWAALAMAISPGFTFYGRYSIHESWLVLFNLILFWGVLRLWRRGDAPGLFAAAAGITGMVLNKETYLIQCGSLLAAFACLYVWEHIVKSQGGLPWAHRQWGWPQATTAAAASIFAILLFYSGAFWKWNNVNGLWQTYALWFRTGADASGGHSKPAFDLWGTPLNWYWLWLMTRYEWPALAGLAAALACMWPCRTEARLAAIYGAGLLLAYSIIPYKTPWCIISLLWPFYLPLGWWLANLRQPWQRPAQWLAAALLAISFLTALRLNFRDYDNNKEPYVYVQTFRDIRTFTNPLLDAARHDERLYHARGLILLESYFPLPWLLGDFPNVAYYGAKNWPQTLDADFIAVDQSRTPDARQKLAGDYHQFTFHLRDAQEPSIAFFRKGVFTPPTK